MNALRKPAATKFCPGCAHTVPLTAMQEHLGFGEKRDLPVCKACSCSSRIASSRALGAVYQGRRG